MNPQRLLEIGEFEVEKIVGMTDDYPYCMHRRDLTDFPIPWHWHEEVELGYIERGVSIIQTLNAEYRIEMGEGFFINTNVMDCKRNGVPTQPLIEVNHLFHPIFLGGHFRSRFEMKYLNPILKNQQLAVWIIRPDHKTGRQLLQTLRMLYELQETPDCEFETRNLLSQAWQLLIADVRETGAQAPSAASDGQERIRAMIAFIHQHYAQKLTAADIARSANISEREALRCFRQMLKTSPTEYLMEYRLNTAQKLLRETTLSVTEIALRCGFSDPAYFGKMFRRSCNAAPSEYRRAQTSSAK